MGSHRCEAARRLSRTTMGRLGLQAGWDHVGGHFLSMTLELGLLTQLLGEEEWQRNLDVKFDRVKGSGTIC